MGKATGVEVARISVKVSPDTDKFREKLKEELAKIERTLKGDVEVTAHLESAQAQADFKRMKAQMEKSGRVKVGVDMVADGGGSGGDGKEQRKSLEKTAGLLDRIKKSMLQFPNFGSGINPTGYLVIFAALATVLSPLAGLLTATLMSLPGLIALVATPIAALTLGLDGLKSAAETLKAPFEDLKASMSSKVEDQFTPVFERLKSVFPTLKESLPAVTQGLADMLNSVVGVATSAAGIEMIRSTITNIGTALSAASPGVGSFASALMRLAANFTGGALQGLVEWFNGAMASFDKFITKLDESGDLDKIFSALGESLKIVVDGLGKIAEIGIDTLKDPEAMGAFNAALKQAVTVIVGLFAVSKMFLDGLGNGAILVGNVFNAVVAAGKSVIGFIAGIPAAISGAWSAAVNSAQAAWGAVVGTVRAAIQTVIGVVFTLGSNLSMAWEAVKAGAAAAWDGLTSIIQTAWNAAVSAIETGISAAISLVSALPGQVAAGLGDLGSLLVASGKALIQGFISGIKAMIGAAVGAAKSVLSAVRNLFPFSPAKEGPFSGKGWVYYSGLSVGDGFASGIKDSTKSAVEAAKDMAAQIKQAIDSGAGQSAFSDISTDDLKQGIAALEEERKRLKIQKNDITDKEGKKALQNQIDQLQAQKDILSYQKDRVKNEEDYSSAAGEDPLVKAVSGLMKAPGDFAAATGKQFLSDIGIGGDGMIGNAITEGIKYIFNIGSVDEALSIKDRQDSKQAMTIAGR